MSRPRSVSDAALLELLKAGKRDKEIAYDLHMHRVTISRLILGMMDRCGARTRCEAVAIYMENGSKFEPVAPKAKRPF